MNRVMAVFLVYLFVFPSMAGFVHSEETDAPVDPAALVETPEETAARIANANTPAASGQPADQNGRHQFCRHL